MGIIKNLLFDEEVEGFEEKFGIFENISRSSGFRGILQDTFFKDPEIFYKKGKYLIITNTVSCGLMMGIGDVIQQKSESWKRKNSSEDEELSSPANNANNEIQKSIIFPNTAENENSLDLMRVRNMLAVGTAQGPFHHYFYAALDKLLPGKNATSIVKKTLLDQTIASPTCLGIFFFGHGALESKDANDMLDELREKFLTVYKVDCCFWPPTQMINFLLVPVRYRVIYVNVMNIIYDIFLSYAKFESD